MVHGNDPEDNGLPPAEEVIVPDDARELAREVQAYHREQRALRRHRRWERLRRLPGRRGPTPPLLIGVLVLATCGAALLVFGAPLKDSSPQPIAGRETSVGALLPDIDVSIDGEPQPLRTLRPAVLTLVPAGCGCEQALIHLVERARAHGVPLYLVESGGRTRELNYTALLLSENGPRPQVVEEPRGVLASRYHASGLTAIVVDSSGTVTAVRRDLGPHAELDEDLTGLEPARQGRYPKSFNR